MYRYCILYQFVLEAVRPYGKLYRYQKFDIFDSGIRADARCVLARSTVSVRYCIVYMCYF